MRSLLAWIRRNRLLVFLAALAIVMAIGAWLTLAPAQVRVAIPEIDTSETKILEAYARAFSEHGKDVRLSIVRVNSFRAAAQALERREADFALVRPDIAYPDNGLTAAILRDEALIVVAPASKKFDGIDKLVGKRLGMIMRDDSDAVVLNNVLNFYGASAVRIAIVRLDPADLETTDLGKRVDALGFLGTPRDESAVRQVRAAGTAFGEEVALVPFEGLEPLENRNPTLRELSIEQGTFGLKPKLPAEETKTAALSYRLIASDQLDRITVSRVVQYLFEMRPRIARDHPTVNLMRAPENEGATSAALPNHRGALDYFNREQQSFMDRWGDWLWLSLFAIGGLTSTMAWLRGLFMRRRRELSDRVLDRLLCVATDAREAKSQEQLDDLWGQLERLVVHAVRDARLRSTGTSMSVVLAIDAARAAIAERRRSLGLSSAPDEQPRVGKLTLAVNAAAE
jgi:TRAP-type uncharacterized transport system substrate-binding protein